MAEPTEPEAAPKTGATKSRAPKTIAEFSAVHAGETRKPGQHRYNGKDDDGNQVQVYIKTSKPRKTVTVTVS